MNEDIVEVLVTIGNAKKVKDRCEPNIMQPMELKSWMVKRTLYALRLFEAGGFPPSDLTTPLIKLDGGGQKRVRVEV